MNTAARHTISLLLVDDHAMFREGLTRLLEKEPDLIVVGQCSSSSEALAVLNKSRPTVVLLDIDLGDERALDFMMEARKDGFRGQVLVLTGGLSGQEAVQLLRSGVSGILHKHHTGEVLRNAIRQVAAGGVFLENDYLRSLFHSVQGMKIERHPLTDRERQLLRLLFQGLRNKEIAARLDISESAVKISLHRLFDKLGARTRAQLVSVAMEHYRDQL